MKLSTSSLLLLTSASVSNAAFVANVNTPRSSMAVNGYLDDLSQELYAPEDKPDIEGDAVENNRMSKEQLDRFGPGNWNEFVEFSEFDGGDGQMGVAGDGKVGLDKDEFNAPQVLSSGAQTIDKSRMRSAKNAWGTSTGYADELLKSNKDIDVARAQQLENWHQQREVKQRSEEMKKMSESFDQVAEAGEEDWRTLAKFGVERNTDVDLDQELGALTPGDIIEGVIDLHTAMNSVATHTIPLKNPYMGFADFRAGFAGTSWDWTIEPQEGSLTKTPIDFVVKFKPTSPGVQEGYFVIETEDFKKTWRVLGNTA